MGDFNIDMLDQNSTQLFEIFIKHYSMELQFKEIITIYGTHIDHIWTNAPTEQCMLGIIEAYWIDLKPTYFPFKLLDYVPQYHYIN